jgi:hypothetical protein
MPKRSSKRKDVVEIAHDMMLAIESGNIAKTPDGKDPIAVAMGRRGGLKGGPARTASMTPEERKELARKAAAARWSRGSSR